MVRLLIPTEQIFLTDSQLLCSIQKQAEERVMGAMEGVSLICRAVFIGSLCKYSISSMRSSYVQSLLKICLLSVVDWFQLHAHK
jgi:hypothetical protein